jgi:hypothetical protein
MLGIGRLARRAASGPAEVVHERAMPDPDRLLRTIQLALSAFAATPGRRGRLVCTEQADEVLIAGDLHGNLENFRQVMRAAELGKHPRRHLVLQELIHGSFRYPGGGDTSHQLLDLLAALKYQFPKQVHMLLGNHELAQWMGRWIAKAAQADLDLGGLFRAGVDGAYGPRAAEIYAAYMELFARVPLAIRTPNRVFLSHSLPGKSRLATFDPACLEKEPTEEADLAVGGSVHSLLWGRDTTADTAAGFLAKVEADLLVTGHIPCPNGFDVPNDRQLILDALGAPAAYCLFPTTRVLTLQELVDCVRLL